MLLSIKAVHVLFITMSITLCVVFGVWSVHQFKIDGGARFLCSAVGSFAAGVGLIGYLVWFVRKIIRLEASQG